jgi:hypothetical protein
MSRLFSDATAFRLPLNPVPLTTIYRHSKRSSKVPKNSEAHVDPPGQSKVLEIVRLCREPDRQRIRRSLTTGTYPMT